MRYLLRTITLAALFLAVPLVQANERATIAVKGEGRISVDPDRVTIYLGAVADAPTAIEAQSIIAKNSNAAIAALESLDLTGITLQTRGISLDAMHDQRDRNDPNPSIIGYTATTTIIVRFDDVTRVAEVLDAAVSAGSNQINGINFSLQDDAPYKAKALAMAVADAKFKASAISQAAGVPLGSLISIIESGVSTSMSRHRVTQMVESIKVGGKLHPPQIKIGTVVVHASLSATYALGSEEPNQ